MNKILLLTLLISTSVTAARSNGCDSHLPNNQLWQKTAERIVSKQRNCKPQGQLQKCRVKYTKKMGCFTWVRVKERGQNHYSVAVLNGDVEKEIVND